jgi:hypothetical protein
LSLSSEKLVSRFAFHKCNACRYALGGGGCAKLAACYQSGLAEKLVDFDDHLDDLTKDWRNPHLDDAIAKA